MSRPKDKEDRHIIVDLSFGDSESVNDCIPRGVYDSQDYILTLPSLDYLLAYVLRVNNPCLINIDIARAFRNIRIDPGNTLKLCVSHNYLYYIDKSLAFGAAHGTAIFQRVLDGIRRIMQVFSVQIWNYIDDLFARVPTQFLNGYVI